MKYYVVVDPKGKVRRFGGPFGSQYHAFHEFAVWGWIDVKSGWRVRVATVAEVVLANRKELIR